MWAGEVPLHEWTVGPGVGSAGEVLTWLFAEGSFALAARLTASGAQSVVTDHLGTPLALYDGQGKHTWQAQLDCYRAVRQGRGQATDCPFRYQGQYEDQETGLYYNRARYYDPEMGQYISQYPIGLLGVKHLYGYAPNSASRVDPLGLAPWLPGRFGTWFDQATPAQILANKSSISAALRGEGGMHEMFPVSMAAKTRELGFTHAELMDMTMPRDQVWFENVPGRPSDIHMGPHSTGAVLLAGQSSKASFWFHKNLEAELRHAISKEQARAIIRAHHNTHATGSNCG